MLIDIYIIFLGLILGSFASALAHRIPRQKQWLLDEIGETRSDYNQSFFHGLLTRSRCTKCHTKLGPLDLIPLISYILRQGKCHYCKEPISIRYPIIEACTACLVSLVFFTEGLSVLGVLLIMLSPFIIASAAIDFEYLILPDEITFLLALSGIGLLIYQSFFSGFVIDPIGDFTSYVLCGLFYGGLGWGLRYAFEKIKGKEGLGWGDIKLFAVAGLWLGWFLMPYYLLLASFMGLIIGGAWRFYKRDALFPFGPPLLISLYLVVLFEPFFVKLF